MKTLGLIGGLSWQSTTLYYQLINQGVQQALGGLHSAPLLLSSVDFAPLAQLQAKDDWSAIANQLTSEAQKLELAGAEGIIVCTNTMHKVAEEIESGIDIPFLHIADATGQALKAERVSKVALLGTAFTMEQAFYKQRLADKFGLEVLVPRESQRQIVHRIIYEELCLGTIKDASRNQYLDIMQDLSERGAQSIILGCTEIGLLVQQSHTQTPLLDTTVVHAQAAVKFLLG